MAEYIALDQLVSLNDAITFIDANPCRKGLIYHDNGTGLFVLKGKTNNCFMRYSLQFNGNIAIPTGGAISPIGVSISIFGEDRKSSESIYTPTVVDSFGNITSIASITVPKGCCFSVAVRYTDATTDDAATVPTPTIEVRNGNLVIEAE